MADVGAGVLKPCREKLGQYLFAWFSWMGRGWENNWHVFVCVYFFSLFDLVLFLFFSFLASKGRF